VHKLSARCDDIRVKFEARVIFCLFIIKHNLVSPISLDLGFSHLLLLGFLGRAEPTRSLLVKFGSRRNTINCKVQYFLGLNNANDLICIGMDVVKDFFLALWLWSILWMGTRVNNTVHVEVEVVDFGVILFYLFLLNRLLALLVLNLSGHAHCFFTAILAGKVDLVRILVLLLGNYLLFLGVLLCEYL